MTGMVRDIEPDVARMKKAAGEGYATATDLADWLVRELNIPFRQAHHITGSIVAAAAKDGMPLHRVPLADMQKVEPQITDEVFKVLSVDRSVQSRTSYGGTAPKNVRVQAKRWLKRLGKGDEQFWRAAACGPAGTAGKFSLKTCAIRDFAMFGGSDMVRAVRGVPS